MLSFSGHCAMLAALQQLPGLRVLSTRGFNPPGPQLDALTLALPRLEALHLSREFSMDGGSAPAFQRLVTQLKVGSSPHSNVFYCM